MLPSFPGAPPSLRPDPSLTLRFAAAGALSLVAWILLETLIPRPLVPWSPAMLRAAERMGAGVEALARHCRERGIPVDPAVDPNGTCLIGPEVTELFTTLGEPGAKRTTTVPDMAALLVHFLEEAGVVAGDRVAVGASGSFPALLVATLVAVEALEARPVVILSLGASSFGATRPDFHLLDIHRVLLDRGIVATPPAAVSLGGEGDVGAGFDPAFREGLLAELGRTGLPLLDEKTLRGNVFRRMEIYLGEGPPSAFVNIGGSEANLGRSPRILEVPPGLILQPASALLIPPEKERGVLFEMAARGVPLVHLLHIRGLALRHGLSWDPASLPLPGATRLRTGETGGGPGFWLLSLAYGASLAGIALAGRGRGKGTAPQAVR